MSDDSLKRALEEVGAAYAESFNRKDAAGIAALYVDGGLHVNEQGPRKDIEQFYRAALNAGSSIRMVISLDEVWSLRADVATAVGEVHVTGRDQNGASIDRVRRCTLIYVREGGKWKMQMATALPKL